MLKQVDERSVFLDQLVSKILTAQNDHILRVAINGVDGSGKTSLVEELAPLLNAKGANVIRASIDGFHNPRSVRYAKGKTSPEGFYRDSFNFKWFKKILLAPLSPGGNLLYKTAAFDHLTDRYVEMQPILATTPSILLIDGVFLFIDELVDHFDLKIFLDVPFATSCARRAKRDESPTDPYAAENKRYVVGHEMYFAECQPQLRADILIDYTDLNEPIFL